MKPLTTWVEEKAQSVLDEWLATETRIPRDAPAHEQEKRALLKTLMALAMESLARAYADEREAAVRRRLDNALVRWRAWHPECQCDLGVDCPHYDKGDIEHDEIAQASADAMRRALVAEHELAALRVENERLKEESKSRTEAWKRVTAILTDRAKVDALLAERAALLAVSRGTKNMLACLEAKGWQVARGHGMAFEDAVKETRDALAALPESVKGKT